MKKNTQFFILYNLIITLFLFVLLEGCFEKFLNNPKYIPNTLVPGIRKYYMDYDRNIIQYLNESSVYDGTTFYRLRPGKFKFSNREFDTNFEVNKLGFRDDEISADKPEIIVLGDSYAMGWGVEQDSTFANRLETNLNFKTLNTGVSSFGTVREVQIINEVNTDSLKFLIIQYCNNDFDENKLFYENKNELKVSTKAAYLANCEEHRKSKNYYPFKHVISICGILGRRIGSKMNSSTVAPDNNEVIDPFSMFLNALKYGINKIPTDTEIIIFSIDYRKSDRRFIEGLKQKLKEEQYSNYKNRISLIDFSSDLDEDKFFILDDHLTSSGHKVISNKLEKLIRSKIDLNN